MTSFFSFALLPFASAFVTTLLTTPLASKIAWKLDAVDYPSRRRVNTKPTPRMGGIAIMIGLLIALAVGAIAFQVSGWSSIVGLSTNGTLNYFGVVASIVGIFLIGAIDDVVQLTALNKFFWQIVAASVAAASGVVVGDIANPVDGSFLSLGVSAYLITVLYLVSFANIINLIDGIDGLATGITVLCGAALFAISIMAGRMASAVLAAALVGSALGFLRWNFNPAKIFLGDSGSLLLGFCLGVISLMGTTYETGLTMLFIPAIMVGVPVLDTFAAIVRRTRVGVSIGTPDKGHIHHRLLDRGFGQRAVVSVLYACTALLCLSAFVITQIGTMQRVLVVTTLVIVAFLAGMFLRIFVPVVRKRFDPETGENEVVPIDEVGEEEDYTKDEITSVILGGIGGHSASNDDLPKTEKPLRILAVSQHYWPEPFAIPDVCEGLAAMGHSVTVLTGMPNYPDGDIYPGYEHGVKTVQDRNGVHIERVKLVPRGREIWQRVLNYYSFSINATRKARKMDADYDVVLSFQTSPVMMSKPALAYGKKNGVPVLLWCQDLWPESLTVGNIKRSSLIYMFYARVSRAIYSAADCLAVSSKAFGHYFKTQLHMDKKTVYLPQYAEDIFEENTSLREEYDPMKINLTFAGNVGIAQAVNTLIEAGHYLKDDKRFSLHVVGSGSELETLKKYKEEIGAECVIFHGRHPLAEMPSFYNSSDAMVATFQNNSILGYTLPRKITSYMAAGRPILGTVVGEARHVIEEAGCRLCCDAEDSVGLAEICKKFADMSPEERAAMGANGRRYYEEHFAKQRFYSVLENELQKIKKGQND
jgi:UDP-N-acetylmuramyl pentapeptide phosphotransferase/UDP-N-acetylglucosamine-1-phosphate transferase/glycosyltransferase involved in cell wall biosynthesis